LSPWYGRRVGSSAASTLNKQSRTADKVWFSSLGLGVWLQRLTVNRFYC